MLTVHGDIRTLPKQHAKATGPKIGSRLDQPTENTQLRALAVAATQPEKDPLV